MRLSYLLSPLALAHLSYANFGQCYTTVLPGRLAQMFDSQGHPTTLWPKGTTTPVYCAYNFPDGEPGFAVGRPAIYWGRPYPRGTIRFPEGPHDQKCFIKEYDPDWHCDVISRLLSSSLVPDGSYSLMTQQESHNAKAMGRC